MQIQEFIKQNGLLEMDEDTFNRASIYGDLLSDHTDFEGDEDFYYNPKDIAKDGELRNLWELVKKPTGSFMEIANSIIYYADKSDGTNVVAEDDEYILIQYFWDVYFEG